MHQTNQLARHERHGVAHREPRRERGQTLGWVITVIAVIIIVVLVVMLIQSRRGAGDVRQQAEQQVQELQVQLRASEARARLNSLLAAIRADVDEEALRSQYQSIRSDLEAAYEDAEGSAAEMWSRLEEGLDNLDSAIGESAQDAEAAIQGMLDALADQADGP